MRFFRWSFVVWANNNISTSTAIVIFGAFIGLLIIIAVIKFWVWAKHEEKYEKYYKPFYMKYSDVFPPEGVIRQCAPRRDDTDDRSTTFIELQEDFEVGLVKYINVFRDLYKRSYNGKEPTDEELAEYMRHSKPYDPDYDFDENESEFKENLKETAKYIPGLILMGMLLMLWYSTRW